MRLTVQKILSQIIFEKPECKTDSMKLYYEYLRYMQVPILQIAKILYDSEFRKQFHIVPFATVERMLRRLKQREEV